MIEGANTITLVDTDLSSSLADKWGVMIYQSMSGDAEGTRGVFTMTGGSLANTAATGPLFYVNNSTGDDHPEGREGHGGFGDPGRCQREQPVGQQRLERWQRRPHRRSTDPDGDMTADNISTIAVTLQNSSALTGAINTAHTAKTVNLTLDASSTWTVTADSTLTCLRRCRRDFGHDRHQHHRQRPHGHLL